MMAAQPIPQAMLIEKEYSYILRHYLPDHVISGFTKPNLEGDPAEDAGRALSFSAVKFGAAYMKQVHGNEVKIIDRPGIYNCDGIFSGSKNLALFVKTADCMPLIFFSSKEAAAGVVHMGWRSARDGILDNIPYDLSSFNVIALVGLRRCCYEVGGEFMEYGNVGRQVSLKDGKYYFDAVAFAKASLISKGLEENRFVDIGICSLCSGRGFFSHRKDATLNRTLSFIAKI